MYKVRHIPTGLFFRNSNSTYVRKGINLDKVGKLYERKPSFFNRGFSVRWREGKEIRTVNAKATDFELVEYSVLPK